MSWQIFIVKVPIIISKKAKTLTYTIAFGFLVLITYATFITILSSFKHSLRTIGVYFSID